jgi:DNA-binding transcriptional ArsR family regulator
MGKKKTADWVSVLLAMYDKEVTVEKEVIKSQRREVGKSKEDTISPKIQPREIASRHVDLISGIDISQPRVAEVINYLYKQGLVETSSPPFGINPIIYRLSGEGFKIAHDLQASRKQRDWRKRNQLTNGLLAAATVILALNAITELWNVIWIPIRPVSMLAILFVGLCVGAVFGRWIW